MDEILYQLNEFVHEKQHFTARYLDKLSQVSGQSPDALAKAFGAIFVLVTLLHPNAHFLVNLLIVTVICLLTYIYRAERPNRDNLLVLWLCFSVLTLFDRLAEVIPLYYVLKVAVLILLFLRPIRAVSKIKTRLFKLRVTKDEGLVSADSVSRGSG